MSRAPTKEQISKVQGFFGSRRTEKKKKSDQANMAKARESRWIKKDPLAKSTTDANIESTVPETNVGLEAK